jgi:hypothetical protein
MSIVEALAELKAILGKGLYPAAIPKVRKILVMFKEGDVGDSQMAALSKRK